MSSNSKKSKVKAKVEADARKVGKDVKTVVQKADADLKKAGKKIKSKA